VRRDAGDDARGSCVITSSLAREAGAEDGAARAADAAGRGVGALPAAGAAGTGARGADEADGDALRPDAGTGVGGADTRGVLARSWGRRVGG
jgi:hypothetical protein